MRSNPVVNLVLLIATMLTTLFAGAAFADVNSLSVLRSVLNTGDWQRLIPVMVAGAPFAIYFPP